MITLRHYQEKAVADLTADFYRLLPKSLGQKRQKLIFKAPTGAGKTVTMAAFLQRLAQELSGRYDLPHRQFAFVWIAPNQLHLQSYGSLLHFFAETRLLRPIQFADITDGKLLPNDLLFLNWQSISSDKNLLVRDNEQDYNLYSMLSKSRLNDTEIVLILDEAHLFAAKGEQAQKVLQQVQANIEIEVSATPYFRSDFQVTVHREDVVAEGMIKKGVHLNPAVSALDQDERELNQYLVKMALEKRQDMAQRYQAAGTRINPLLLIQLPNDSASESALDRTVLEQGQAYLAYVGITTQNHRLAIWLSKEKQNLDDLSADDNLTEVLLFKQAIALGWDCPRAHVLLIFRDIQSIIFSVQTVGRILRMPQQRHYADEALNVGYVYTNLARNVIQIVADEMNYLSDKYAIRKANY
ncbi:hypothetical protein BH24BAC1_BH24BAC1_32140 [soil metagenome]